MLCFNRTLADRIDAQLRQRGVDERVQVRTFHSWCQDMVRSYQLHVQEAPNREAHFRLLADTVERSVATGFIPGGQYTALLIDARDASEEADLVAQRIEALLADGLAGDEIAVLFRAKYLMVPLEQALHRRRIDFESMNARGFRHFDWTRPAVRLLTMHSAKGLEFAHVFIGGLQALPMKGESLDDALRLLHVAMTRATRQRVLAGWGASSVTIRVRSALERVATRFAEHAESTPRSPPS